MSAFQHILVGTDFGEAADRALDVALDLAPLSKAVVTILYVSLLPPSAYAPYAQGPYFSEDEMSKSAQHQLDRLIDRARERYDRVGGVLSSGDPAERILEVARDEDVDLIVVGTHSRHGLPRIVMGSVAETVARGATVPVLTVPAKASSSPRASSAAPTGVLVA
jgi:nucleotide-binding universal stress UspA family protein